MSRIRTFRTVALLSIALLGLLTLTTAVYAQEHATPATQEAAQPADDDAGMQPAVGRGIEFLAVAVTMGLACLAAGLAVGKVGSAAMGAAAEKPEILTKAIVFAGLGEGIAIFGLIVSLFLINKL
jgi:V/A-type H+-transporting ATPase subunit K